MNRELWPPTPSSSEAGDASANSEGTRPTTKSIALAALKGSAGGLIGGICLPVAVALAYMQIHDAFPGVGGGVEFYAIPLAIELCVGSFVYRIQKTAGIAFIATSLVVSALLSLFIAVLPPFPPE